MASVINKIHGSLMKPYQSVTDSAGQVLVGPATYAWRAKILINRATSLKEQSDGLIFPSETLINTTASRIFQKKREVLIKAPKMIVHDKPTVPTVRNTITIVNPNTNADGKGSYESIVIQGMPEQVNCDSESTWVSIKSVGRNNPIYLYTGGEDTISFDVSWYSIEKDRGDVIKKCRLLESWTKADGYKSSPPELWISWGSAELFKNDTFILTEAPYVLSNFQNSYRPSRKDNIIDLGLLPNVATQKLVFKRVTKGNRTYTDMQRSGNKAPEPLPSNPIPVPEVAKKPDKFE